MSSSRKTRPIEPAVSGPDINALTAQVRAQLKHYISHAVLVNNALKDVNQIQTELDVDLKPINLVKGRLDRAYDLVGTQASEELQRIDTTIEVLDLLLKHPATLAATQAHAAQTQAGGASTPGAAAKRGPYKKRKTDTGSQAGSPAASRAGSPNSLATSPGASGPLSGKASSTSGKSGPSGKMGKSTAKSRRDAITAQLPLTSGRQVAFKQPVKGGAASGQKEEWILAVIVNSIDKNRYTVQDIDYDPTSQAPDGGKYNTTLKSIIPLPDKRIPSSFPEFDFHPGTNVLALYPDTTSFYRAVVQSGPAPATGQAKKTKDKYYKVKFEDDDDNVREIAQELVVEVP
ncbi:hypothetical protein OIV83_002838 [Microbotryomycetes sp. JL201]|nr:hypothetical protein OIV83_002838 [Microbotryomycetes sp. JL201]